MAARALTQFHCAYGFYHSVSFSLSKYIHSFWNAVCRNKSFWFWGLPSSYTFFSFFSFSRIQLLALRRRCVYIIYCASKGPIYLCETFKIEMMAIFEWVEHILSDFTTEQTRNNSSSSTHTKKSDFRKLNKFSRHKKYCRNNFMKLNEGESTEERERKRVRVNCIFQYGEHRPDDSHRQPKWNHSSKNISWFMKNARNNRYCSEFIRDFPPSNKSKTKRTCSPSFLGSLGCQNRKDNRVSKIITMTALMMSCIGKLENCWFACEKKVSRQFFPSS